MDNLKEIYVAKKDKDYVLAKIDTLCRKYHNRIGVNDEQRKALFKSYCHDTVEVFEECWALKFTPDIKFVNDETLNEFVVTVSVKILMIEIMIEMIEINP